MSPPNINRRDFAKGLAVGAVGPALLTGRDAPAQQQPNEPTADELLVRQIVQEQSDERITDEVVGEIQSDVRGNRSRGKRLSAFPLHNSDEPGFLFAAYRKADD